MAQWKQMKSEKTNEQTYTTNDTSYVRLPYRGAAKRNFEEGLQNDTEDIPPEFFYKINISGTAEDTSKLFNRSEFRHSGYINRMKYRSKYYRNYSLKYLMHGEKSIGEISCDLRTISLSEFGLVCHCSACLWVIFSPYKSLSLLTTENYLTQPH